MNYRIITPATIYQLFIILMCINWVFPISETKIFFPWNLTGIILLATGTVIAIKAKGLFKKTNTPLMPTSLPVILHSTGIYGISRNPMYFGIAIGIFGIAILSGELINFIFPVLYIIIVNQFYIKEEERNLEIKFGEKYLEYKKRTRKWI